MSGTEEQRRLRGNDSHEWRAVLCRLGESDETQMAKLFPGRPLDAIVSAGVCSLPVTGKLLLLLPICSAS